MKHFPTGLCLVHGYCIPTKFPRVLFTHHPLPVHGTNYRSFPPPYYGLTVR